MCAAYIHTATSQIFKNNLRSLTLSFLIFRYGEYPIGHPKIILDNFEKIDVNNHPYKGIIKCSVLPPKKLLHPLIPNRSKNKLLFPLCAKCGTERCTRRCTHTDEERTIHGEWVSLELYKAVELGYKVMIKNIRNILCIL